jgi:hypothetical protein
MPSSREDEAREELEDTQSLIAVNIAEDAKLLGEFISEYLEQRGLTVYDVTLGKFTEYRGGELVIRYSLEPVREVGTRMN